MANTLEKFPRLPERQWWTLREKFKQTMPSRVTPSYLATVASMKESSAAANILPALRQIGLVDGDGKPTDVALRWRDDITYPEVCQEIRERMYPQELLDAIPDPNADRETTERWFANRTGHGVAAVRKMAAFYALVSAGDPARVPGKAKSDAPGSPKGQAKSTRSTRVKKEPAPKIDNPAQPPASQDLGGRTHTSLPSGLPSVHVDVQIHLSPDAPPEQIEQIFSSMAKYLYRMSAEK